MTANTVYEVYNVLSEQEKQRFIVMVNKEIDNNKTIDSTKYNLKKIKSEFSKQDAIDYLIKNVFCSKIK